MLNPADAQFLDHLAQSLPENTLRPAEPRYLTEPRGRWSGVAGAVACPGTTAEVARIVTACSAAGVGIIPWGGGTGLVGGQIMPDGPLPLILSLERMAGLRAVYPTENVIVVESGMILSDVQAQAQRLERIFPLSLASEGSARIGGNLATNAGGLNVLRYGNARDLCLGIEAVLPDGSIFHGLKRLRKDNTGYDLRHLLIGSEGSLGVITAAALRVFARPASVAVALVQVTDPAAALELLARAERRLAGMITAFELIGQMGVTFLHETMPEIHVPLNCPWMVLIEVGLPQGFGEASTHLESLLAGQADGVIAQSQAQSAALWRIRESIPEANRRIGAISSHDISLPLSNLPEFVRLAGEELAKLGDFRINCFGHLGDGNLHYNVFPARGRTRKDYENQRDSIKSCVHDLVDAMAGSVSAEHGLGRLKRMDLEKYGDPAKLAAMRAIKAALDPKGIMNPGAVIIGHTPPDKPTRC